MPGIQSRGRTRNNTNKIEQVKTQNKVITTKKRSTRYQPRPSSGKLDQSTQNQIQPTDSNIAQAVTVGKAKQMGLIINKSKEPINAKELTPLGRIGLGAVNQVTDYEGIVNWDHESKSILNQSLEKGFSGDWEGAYKHIQDNPYRFAGNLAVEVGSALIPATWGIKAVKYGAQVAKAGSKAKHAKKSQEALDTLPTVKKTPRNYVYAKPDSGTDYVRVSDMQNPETVFRNIIGRVTSGHPSSTLEKFNFVKQVSTDTGENVISIIPKKFLGTSNTEIFDKTTQGVLAITPSRLSRLSSSTKNFKPEILSKSESLSVLKGLRAEIKVGNRTELRRTTLLKRNYMREPSMTGHPATSRWRLRILKEQVKEKFGFGAPVFRFAESPGAKAHVNILEPNTINFSKFSSGTTPKDAVNTKAHETIHLALRAAGPGTLKSNKSFVETSRMQNALDDISYMSDKSNQKGMVSTLNKESYTVAEVKKMSPDKLDLLMREQRALGNTDKFIPGKQFNWKKSSAPEIRRTSKYDGNSFLLGIDDTLGLEKVADPQTKKMVDATTFSNLSPEANYKVMTSYPESPLYNQFKLALPIKTGKIRPLASEIDDINKTRNMLKEINEPAKIPSDWFGVAKDSALPGGIITAKVLQYDNQIKKNKYQKNKAKTQSFGGFGQFL